MREHPCFARRMRVGSGFWPNRALIPRARTNALRAFMRGAPFSQREKDDVTAAPMSAIAPGR